MMINVFNQEGYIFFSKRDNAIKEEINKLNNEQIVNTNMDEWLEYFYSKYEIQPICLYLEHISNSGLNEIKIPVASPFNPSKIIQVDGCSIEYKIPFSGDSSLLYLHGSRGFFSNLVVDKIKEPKDSECGYILYTIAFKINDYNSSQDKENFINQEFKNKFRYIKESAEFINTDVKDYNKQLINLIKASLTERLSKAKTIINISETSKIPLKKNIDAPNITPIKLIPKPKPAKPTVNNIPSEYEISEDDYKNIINIIDMTCISFERTSKTFNKLEEEELRDIILSNLNTHYNNATGETFSKSGKTDIYLQFNRKSAYIAECKIWKGEKIFKEAVAQLFGYITWRDSKTSIILFNKKNKDFNKILQTLEKLIKEDSLCIDYYTIGKNIIKAKYKKDNTSTEIINIVIMIYDLYLNEE